jgi:hypothetical protein
MKFTAKPAVLVAVAIAAGVTGCGSVSAGQTAGAVQSSSSTPAPSAPTGSTSAKPVPTPLRSSGPPSPISVDSTGPGPQYPAAISSGNDTQPLNNMVVLSNTWGTGDGQTSITVDAGASGADSSNGLFIILRQTQAGGQSLKTVTVAGSGAVRISSAPLGVSVETSAQTGDLSFDSDSGMSGVLHLSDDTITITSSGTATPTAS